jgi:hypothetical protein
MPCRPCNTNHQLRLHVFRSSFQLEAHSQKNGCPSRSTCLPSALTVRARRRVASSDAADRGVVILCLELWEKGERTGALTDPPALSAHPLGWAHFRHSLFFCFIRLAVMQQRPKWITEKEKERKEQQWTPGADARAPSSSAELISVSLSL